VSGAAWAFLPGDGIDDDHPRRGVPDGLARDRAITAGLRPTTFHGHEMAVNRINGALGRSQLQALTPLQIEKFYADELASGGHDGRSLAPKTVRDTHVVLREVGRLSDDRDRRGSADVGAVRVSTVIAIRTRRSEPIAERCSSQFGRWAACRSCPQMPGPPDRRCRCRRRSARSR
jgi:hypothetical protein